MNSLIYKLVVISLVTVAGRAWAHEGESHDEAAVSSVPVGENRVVHAVSGDRFELVVKHSPIQPDQNETLDLYLSDFATNEPVIGAQISLVLRGPDGEAAWESESNATDFPGIYRAELAVADTGLYNLIARVKAGDREDSFALPGLRVMYPAADESGGTGPSWLMWALVVVVGMVGLVVGFLGGRRGHRRAGAIPLSIGLLMAPLLASPRAAAEGPDETPQTSSSDVMVRGTIHLPKESQFLLDVRTERAVSKTIPKRWGVLGRVRPEVGCVLRLRATQSGRVFPVGASFPSLGQRVRAGEALAVLVVVDSLILRSTLSGVITEVNVAPSQFVEAGQEIMTVVDPSAVLVHADVFQVDIPKVRAAKRAWVEIPGDPGRPLEGRKVAISITSGEVAGAAEMLFRVPNKSGRLRIGSIVNVYIDLGTVSDAVVIPRSALVEREGRTLAFVHVSPEEFEVRQVNVVTLIGHEAAIDRGLQAGDRVVISGLYALMPGANPAYGGR